MSLGIIDSSQKIITNGLVLHLDAAQKRSYSGTGTVWTDLSGNGNNGTLVNNPTFNSANGGSIVFDGTDDYVNCGNSNQLTGITNFTASAWVYPTTTNDGVYVTRYYNTTINNGWILTSAPGIIDTSKIRFTTDGRESSAEYLRTVTVEEYSLNQWYYVTGSKQGNNWRIYVNGALKLSSNLGIGTTVFGVNDVNIGRVNTGTPVYKTAKINSVLVYNRALSDAEILQNYNATKSRFGL